MINFQSFAHFFQGLKPINLFNSLNRIHGYLQTISLIVDGLSKSSTQNINNLPSYTDNASAKVAGLTVGNLYHVAGTDYLGIVH